MIRSASAFMAALLVATSARAAPAKAAPPKAAKADTAVSEARPSPLLGWAGLGVYDVRQSYTVFGVSGTSSDAEFGLNVGGAMNLAQLTPDVPLAGFANVAMSFASGGQFFPLTAGLAVRYDKLPVRLLGGLGLTLMPNTISPGPSAGVGLGILLMGLYPLPQVDPRFSLQGQIQFHVLTQSLSLIEFLIGVGYSI
jgi:hypothetical protein